MPGSSRRSPRAVAGDDAEVLARAVGDAEAARRPQRVRDRPRREQRPAHVPAAIDRGEAAVAPDDGEAPVRRPRGARPRAEPPPLAARLDDPRRATRGDEQAPAGRQPVGGGHAARGRVRAQADGGADPVGHRVPRRAQRRDQRERRPRERRDEPAARASRHGHGPLLELRDDPQPRPLAGGVLAGRRGAQQRIEALRLHRRSPSSSVSSRSSARRRRRVDRAAGQVEHARDLARRVAEPVAQDDHRPLVDRQRAQCGHDLLRPALLGRRGRGHRIRGHRLQAPGAGPVDRAVDHDAGQPRPERAAAVEAVERPQRRDEGLLGDVLRRRSVVHHEPRGAVGARPVQGEQRLEVLRRSALGAAHQPPLRRGRRHPRPAPG